MEGNCLQTFYGHKNCVNSAVFSHNDKFILTASPDKTSKLWDIKGNYLQTFYGHKDQVISAIFSHNDKFILTVSYDNTCKLWYSNINQNLLYYCYNFI